MFRKNKLFYFIQKKVVVLFLLVKKMSTVFSLPEFLWSQKGSRSLWVEWSSIWMVDLCFVAPKRFWEMNGKWCFVWKNWFIHEFMNRLLICMFITWHSLPLICGGIVAWQWRLHLSLRRCCSYYLVVCGHAICWHNWTVYTLEDNVEPTNHPFRKENDLPNLHYYVPC